MGDADASDLPTPRPPSCSLLENRRILCHINYLAYVESPVFDFFNQPISIPENEISDIEDLIQDAYTAMRPKDSPPHVLHHYTDATGFLGIVESGSLRATHIAFMNDATEYKHAFAILREIVKERTLNSPIAATQFSERLLSELAKSSEPENFPPVFVACLSSAENSLNQWRAYGRGEGGISYKYICGML
jgi:hypothetical protein